MKGSLAKWLRFRSQAARVVAYAGIAGFCILLVLTGVFTAAWFDRTPLLFQSWESKGSFGDPVYNRVAFFPGRLNDVWMMQQSHVGPAAQRDEWDRIAIVVSHDRERTATYYQLPSGPLEADELRSSPVADVGKRAQCYLCHANGPRVIRLEPKGTEVVVGAWDRVRLLVWNSRIKTYGRFAPTEQDQSSDYRIQSPLANRVLSSPSCVSCHPAGAGSKGILPSRGTLRRQHFMAIDFMLQKGLMPPPGFSLPPEEKEQILRFIGSN